jgi:DnaA family protein
VKGEQLALSVQLRSTASFDTYFAGPNEAALAALRELHDSPIGGIYLFGPDGVGKSHLLLATARHFQQQGLRVAYLPLANFAERPIELLDGADEADLLALDDLDIVSADRDWAYALIRRFDKLRANQRRWLVSASHATDRLDCAIPDLRTRLHQSARFGLRALDDADRSRWLRENALARGLELPDEAARWLIHHLPRDAASLIAALDTLDRASLSAKRRLTLPFVQKTLG